MASAHERRQDALIQQAISALRKPWVNGQVLQIIGGKPTWGAAPAGGTDLSYALCKPQDASSDPWWIKDPGNTSNNFMCLDGRTPASGHGILKDSGDGWSVVDPVSCGRGIALSPPGPGIYQFSCFGFVSSANAGSRLYFEVFDNAGGYFWTIDGGVMDGSGEWASSIQIEMKTDQTDDPDGPTDLFSIGHYVESTHARNMFPNSGSAIRFGGHRIAELPS